MLAAALVLPAVALFAQEPAAPAAGGDAEARLQWLKERVPAKAVPTPKPLPRVGFRSGTRGLAPREIQPDPTVAVPKTARLADNAPAATPSPETPKAKAPESTAGKTKAGEGRIAKASPTPAAKTAAAASPTPAAGKKSAAAKSSPAPVEKIADATVVEATPSPAQSKNGKTAKASPTPTTKNLATTTPAATPSKSTTIAKASPTPAGKIAAAATPSAKTSLAKLTTPAPAKTAAAATPRATPAASKVAVAASPAPTLSAAKLRASELATPPAPKLALAPAVEAIPSAPVRTQTATRPANLPPPVTHPTTSSGRYPWKTNIVTTVFWVGEPARGNNPTPNHASSWDARWSQSYGGFDNPDPSARRNFIPVRFTPRQNPFYVALPYNDVTRGTTKPEARRVIPWFREAFQREGQSVCRDRWVAIRSKSGRVCYAQWSDCGPFRTDHWQYVFGNERPLPNLNRGAGLDVSPAVRDFLGLDGTDLTDWKFVDFREVPTGPWSRHGENNTFVQRATGRPARDLARGNPRTADSVARGRVREL